MKTYRITSGKYGTSSYRIVGEYKRRKWWEKRIKSLIPFNWTLESAIRIGEFNGDDGRLYKLSIWDD